MVELQKGEVSTTDLCRVFPDAAIILLHREITDMTSNSPDLGRESQIGSLERESITLTLSIRTVTELGSNSRRPHRARLSI